MAGIFDIVQQQLSGGAVQQLAQRAGIDPAIAQQAVTAAVPAQKATRLWKLIRVRFVRAVGKIPGG